MFKDFYNATSGDGPPGDPPDGVDKNCRCEYCRFNPSSQKFFCWWCGSCYFMEAEKKNKNAEYDIGHFGFSSEVGNELWFCSNCSEHVFKSGKNLGQDYLSELVDTKVNEKVNNLASVNMKNYESILKSIADLSQRFETVASVTSKVDDLVEKVSDIKKSCDNLAVAYPRQQDFNYASPPRKRAVHREQDDTSMDHETLPSLFTCSKVVGDGGKDSDTSDGFSAVLKLTAKNLEENAKVMETLVEEKEKDVLSIPEFYGKTAKNGSINLFLRSYSDAVKAKEALQKKIGNTNFVEAKRRNLCLVDFVGLHSQISPEAAAAAIVQDNPGLGLTLSPDDTCSVYRIGSNDVFMTVLGTRKCNSGVYRLLTRMTDNCKMMVTKFGLKLRRTVLHPYDFNPSGVCYNCWKPGHLAKNCSDDSVCGKCSQNHKTRDCTSNTFKCINCTRQGLDDVNHPAYSRKCPSLPRIKS